MTRRLPTLSLAVSLTLCAAAADAESPGRLSFDLLFGDHPAGRTPGQLAWSPEGRRLSYLWSDDGTSTASLRLLEPATGRETVILDPASHDGLTIEASHWSPAGDALLIESSGDLYLLTLGNGELRRLTETAEAESEPAFSPDGGTVAFIRDYDLHLIDLESGRERALTTDGEENAILNGVTDWVYWEEIWGRDSTGYWWSPGGDRIAYYRFDESPVASYPLVDFTAVYPTVEWQKYPTAGEANPIVRVGVIALDSGATTWLDTGDGDDYLARVAWLPSGERISVQRLNRDQNRLELLLCDPAEGACDGLLTETWPTWINLSNDLRFLADGSFVWGSEREGWRRLYLYGPDGELRRTLSGDGWAVSGLDGVVESAGHLLYTAFSTAELGAIHRRVFRQALDGGEPVPLSAAGRWSGALVAERSGLWVHTEGRSGLPARPVVRDADGEKLAALPATEPEFDPAALPEWEFFTLPGPAGSRLPAALLRPEGAQPGVRYPVIMYHYGGPGSQVVVDRWPSSGRGLWHEMMAQRGYGVLKVDNRASLFFGKPGEDRVHRRFGEENLAAQLAGVDYLKSLDWVDAERIGIWGWSGGGSNTLYVVTNRPGTWKAAVAGAPVTDWRLYDTIWTERYLDHPADNPDGYRASSAVTYAGRLADALLIVHGTADDNVHPHNTLQMSKALIEAGRPFQQAIYPRQKHGFRGDASRHFYERMTAFFDRELGE